MKERLLRFREKHGLSQIALAKMIGISPTTIVRLEKGGKPSTIVEGKINKIIGEK